MTNAIHADGKSVMEVIGRFRFFLNSAWPEIVKILDVHDWDDDAYFLEDWLDANWRLLVARQLLGKDNDLQPFAVATNDILKRRFTYWLESSEEHKIFVSLGTVRKTFEIAPPFDMTKIINKDGLIEIQPWQSVKFELKAAS